jgi:hypothetical protein
MGLRLCAATVLVLVCLPLSAAQAETLKLKFGPVKIVPGQNTIDFEAMKGAQKPPGPGYITAFHPDLKYSGTNRTPPVDVVHLHHGVWIVDGNPTWAAGEEKTQVDLPKGFGWRYDPDQKWLINYMIHNLTPTPTTVDLRYTLEFVPDTSPEAKTIRPVETRWLDVQFGKVYPVFDALKGAGGGRFTYPNDEPRAYKADGVQRNRWTVDEDSTLVATAGHVHPGGLDTRLYVTRNGVRKLLFTSRAKYFEPAGAVSWDVAMTNTKPGWRVNVKKGDVLSVNATYDTRRASWYESMGIMPVSVARGTQLGVDPFQRTVSTEGPPNHGHLPENDHHGGGPFGLPDPRGLPAGPDRSGASVLISNFFYGRGDLNLSGGAGRPPTVRQGRSLTFKNLDSPEGGDDATAVFHTITACKAPCNKETGIAYPLADGPVTFDSGELGFGPEGGTAAANRATWRTPKDLGVGTYTYFCRVHPFMRGAFRVVPQKEATS